MGTGGKVGWGLDILPSCLFPAEWEPPGPSGGGQFTLWPPENEEQGGRPKARGIPGQLEKCGRGLAGHPMACQYPCKALGLGER